MDKLNLLFPDAHCELNYQNCYQLLIAVVLSAQTTDVKVNKVTAELFNEYPDVNTLSQANQYDVEKIIHSIGLYRNKASNIINLCKIIIERFNGEIPSERQKLESLPGVGRKTANVVLSEYFNVEAFAVDTHVSRIARRLYIAEEEDDAKAIEEKLCSYFPERKWHNLHHQMIFFGRYKCKSQNPDCVDCPFNKKCRFINEKK